MDGIYFGSYAAATTTTITPSGGITFSGTNNLIVQNFYTLAVSGGVILGTTMPITAGFTYIITPSGSVVIGDTMPIVIDWHRITPEGGIVISGENPLTFDVADSYTLSVSGGIVFSGDNPQIRTNVIEMDGTITINKVCGEDMIVSTYIYVGEDCRPIRGVGK
jgi:hypothetical protein